MFVDVRLWNNFARNYFKIISESHCSSRILCSMFNVAEIILLPFQRWLHVKSNAEIISNLFRNNVYFTCNHGITTRAGTPQSRSHVKTTHVESSTFGHAAPGCKNALTQQVNHQYATSTPFILTTDHCHQCHVITRCWQHIRPILTSLGAQFHLGPIGRD